MEMLSNEADEKQVLVIGGAAAKGLATHLAETWNVELISDEEEVVQAARSDPFDAQHIEFEGEALERCVGKADVAVVASERDRVGLMITQLLNTICEVDDVLVRVDDPKNREAFENIDCKTIDTGSLLRNAVEETLAPVDG